MSNVNNTDRVVKHITLSDGISRPIRFTMNAFAELEIKYGTIDVALEQMDKGSLVAIRYILWLGLLEMDETLTEKQVGGLIEIEDFERIMTDLTKVMGQSLPEQEEAVANPN